MKKTTLITNILNASLFLFLLFSCSQEENIKEEEVRPAYILTVEKQKYQEKRSFPGRTRASQRSNVSFRVSGPMIERKVLVGDKVVKGQVLARIDPRDFEIEITRIQGKLERVEANLRFAKSDYERAKRIYLDDPGAISKRTIEERQENVEQFEGEKKTLLAELYNAQNKLEDTFLRAPFDGKVVATFVEPFEYVQEKQEILRLLNTSKIEVIIDVPEQMIQKIFSEKEMIVTFSAFPKEKFKAKITEIGTEASFSTRTFPVILRIDQPPDKIILAGMIGEATFIDEDKQSSKEEKIIIPTTAIFSKSDPKKTYIWIFDDKTQQIREKEIVVERITDNGVIVEKGLKEGEQIVYLGVNFLNEGQKVKKIAKGKTLKEETSQL